VSYTLLLSMVEFKTLCMRGNIEAALALVPQVRTHLYVCLCAYALVQSVIALRQPALMSSALGQCNSLFLMVLPN